MIFEGFKGPAFLKKQAFQNCKGGVVNLLLSLLLSNFECDIFLWWKPWTNVQWPKRKKDLLGSEHTKQISSILNRMFILRYIS